LWCEWFIRVQVSGWHGGGRAVSGGGDADRCELDAAPGDIWVHRARSCAALSWAKTSNTVVGRGGGAAAGAPPRGQASLVCDHAKPAKRGIASAGARGRATTRNPGLANALYRLDTFEQKRAKKVTIFGTEAIFSNRLAGAQAQQGADAGREHSGGGAGRVGVGVRL